MGISSDMSIGDQFCSLAVSLWQSLQNCLCPVDSYGKNAAAGNKAKGQIAFQSQHSYSAYWKYQPNCFSDVKENDLPERGPQIHVKREGGRVSPELLLAALSVLDDSCLDPHGRQGPNIRFAVMGPCCGPNYLLLSSPPQQIEKIRLGDSGEWKW
jgi:hypothetical protein